MSSKPKRSKNGCETCRQRKVKCDEIHPCCEQCSRLRFACRWSKRERPSVKTTRRGYGPVKSRDSSWNPPAIVPKLPKTTIDSSALIPSISDISSPPELDWNSSAVDSGLGLNERSQGFEINHKSLAHLTFDDETLSFGELPTDGSSPDFPDPEYQFTDHCFGEQYIDQCTLDMVLSSPLSDFHMVLPNSLSLSYNEHEALRHYQTTYSLYRTTKDPNWSTHKVLLRIGSHDAMIMHLLLAVSLNDYSVRVGNRLPSLDAEAHFQAGAQLLISTSTTSSKLDNVLTIAAYFFIYLYMSKRKSTSAPRINQLSSTVLNFVKKHDLVSRCTEPLPLTDQSSEGRAISLHARSLLARLIMWTLDEDVKCSFQGSGGHFARYLAKRSARTKEIYDASRNALGDHWGSLYPHSQILDDDQNSPVLEFLWALTVLWQDINDLDEELDLLYLKLRIEQNFALLEEKYSSVFRHSSERTKPRPRILVNADYDVVLFNALRIYYFRSTIPDLTIDTPPEIQDSLKTILTIIQRTFSSKSTELHDRLQWPLFLAGIETNDTIYREWILSRLRSDRVSAALKQTLDAQEFAGKRLTMAKVRELLYYDQDHSLFATNNIDLADLPAIG